MHTLCLAIETLESPSVTKPAAVDIVEMEDACLQTIVNGKPEPEVNWYLGHSLLYPTESIKFERMDNVHTLTLKSCKQNMSGSVHIIATNKAGEASCETTLAVKGAYDIIIFQNCNLILLLFIFLESAASAPIHSTCPHY